MEVHKMHMIEQIQNFCKFVNCLGFEDFEKMYKDVGFIGKSYINEKFELKNSRFLNWFCELDEGHLEKMIDWMNYYIYKKG